MSVVKKTFQKCDACELYIECDDTPERWTKVMPPEGQHGGQIRTFCPDCWGKAAQVLFTLSASPRMITILPSIGQVKK